MLRDPSRLAQRSSIRVDDTRNIPPSSTRFSHAIAIVAKVGKRIPVARYGYDGLGRRLMKQTFDTAGKWEETRAFYYSPNWQVLEEWIRRADRSIWTARGSGACRVRTTRSRSGSAVSFRQACKSSDGVVMAVARGGDRRKVSR